MEKVYVNNLGYLAGPSVFDANNEIEITDEVAYKISKWPLGKLWRYDWDTKEFNLEVSYDDSELRLLRENECFSIINRSFLWYLSLTEEQKVELQQWYQEWLNITETRSVPKKPDWLD